MTNPVKLHLFYLPVSLIMVTKLVRETCITSGLMHLPLVLAGLFTNLFRFFLRSRRPPFLVFCVTNECTLSMCVLKISSLFASFPFHLLQLKSRICCRGGSVRTIYPSSTLVFTPPLLPLIIHHLSLLVASYHHPSLLVAS